MKNKNKKNVLNYVTIIKSILTILMPFATITFGSISLLTNIFCIAILEAKENSIKFKNNEKSKFNDYYSLVSDEIFTIALLSALSISYPILLVSLGLEIGTAYFNIKSNIDYDMNKQIQKSSLLDRNINMSRALCLIIPTIIPLIPFLSDLLGPAPEQVSNSLSLTVFNKLRDFINMLNVNKTNIENIVIPASVLTEGINLSKKIIEEKKNPDVNEKRRKLIDELKEYRNYINDKYNNNLTNEENNKNDSENIKRLTKK